MGLTTAMYTGLSGMNANQSRIDTIGNNIANVNTTAFKSSRTLLETQFSHLLSAGNGPTETSGGVNPLQIGLGAKVGATQKNFTQGSIQGTGVPSDLAMNGSGFFILNTADNRQVYTRDGSFSVDTNNRLVSSDGNHVMGFAVDEDFNVVDTVLTELTIPLGTLSVAESTGRVQMDGDLSAASTIATQGSVHTTQALVTGGGAAASAGTALSDLRDAAAPTVPLFTEGSTITVSGLTKGDRNIVPQTFVVGQDGSTLGDFASWLEGRLGINTDATFTDSPGVTIDATGAIVIRSNNGEQQSFTIENDDFQSDTVGAALPFQFTQSQAPNGPGVTTSFTVYDSLGEPVNVTASFALESTPDTGPVWRFFLESDGNTGTSRVLGTGLVSFDTQGNFVSATNDQITINRSQTGALTPLTFTFDMSGVHGLSTQTSNVIMATQDGYPPGTLTGYTVGQDGMINGTFSNGLSQPLGQVAVALFQNPEGLVAESDNLYATGPNSGNPTVTPPLILGAGAIESGALELSNVDLSGEFIGLITSSTGFQASSRVISTSSDLLDQLLLIVR